MIKVAFYSPLKSVADNRPSGDREIARSLYYFLESQGFRISVTSHLSTKSSPKNPFQSIFRSFIYLKDLIRLLTNRSDWLFTYHNYYKAPDLFHPLASKILGTHYIVYEPSFKPSLADKKPLLHWLMKRSFKQATLLVCNKAKDYEVMHQYFPQTAVFFRPGISADIILPKDNQSERNRKIRLISVAVLRPKKKFPSVQWLVESLSDLQSRGIDFDYVHVGGGACFESLSDYCEKKMLPGSYRLTGMLNHEETLAELRQADIYVYPGEGEAIGMSYIEAQAQGLPVVAFKNSGTQGVVTHAESGFLCEPFDRRQFNDYLIALMEDAQLRQRMSDKAIDHVKKNHIAESNLSKMLEIIESKTGSRREVI